MRFSSVQVSLALNHKHSFPHPSNFPLSKFPNPSKSNHMVDQDYELPSSFDPFTDPEAGSESFSLRGKEQIHIRIQQRNGKKCLTTVQGLSKDVEFEKVLKELKKEFCCNGNVVQNNELGKIIQLQGDQRKNVSKYLLKKDIVKKERIKVHGY